MIDTRIFKEKFVFIIVDIALFIPIQSLAQFFCSSDWQEDRVPAGITRVVEEQLVAASTSKKVT